MHIIYVDDELASSENFRLTVSGFEDVESLKLFDNGEQALEWARSHTVDMAFLETEMPGMNGLELARRLKELIRYIRIVFVTGHSRYALDAWRIDAAGYVLKPYDAQDIRKELDKCEYHPLPSRHIVIQTIPTFSLMVDNKPIHIAGFKPREMLALLVDRGSRGITVGEGIAYLWPDKKNDANSQSLFRVTYKRLSDALEGIGIGHILESRENRRFLHTENVDCDLYRIFSGDPMAMRKYNGEYMREYSWAEERNGQLYRMLLF